MPNEWYSLNRSVMKKHGVILFSLMICGAVSAQAQHDQEGELAVLAEMEGTWRITAYEQTSAGAWQAGEPTTSTITSLLEGNGFAEQSEVRGPSLSFKLYSVFSYDAFRKIYRSMTLDADEGLMDVYEGTFADNRLTLTNEKAETWFVTGSGTQLKFRLEYVFSSADAYALHVSFAAISSAMWQPMMRIDYERIAP